MRYNSTQGTAVLVHVAVVIGVDRTHCKYTADLPDMQEFYVAQGLPTCCRWSLVSSANRRTKLQALSPTESKSKLWHQLS